MAELLTANSATEDPVNLFGVGRDHKGGQAAVYLEVESAAVVAVIAEDVRDGSECYEWGPFGLVPAGTDIARLVLPVELPSGKLWELTVESVEGQDAKSGLDSDLRRMIVT